MEERVAIVTGASRGIGAAIAARFAAAGAAVVVTARTVDEGDHMLPGSLSATVRAIEDEGGTAHTVVADLSQPADRERVVATALDVFGTVDVLVNNAAVTYFEPVEAVTDRHFDLMFEVQVRAPFDLARRVLPAMRERGQGWILNISSGAARHPPGPPYGGWGGGTVYGMCKAALERFTTGLASEVYSDRIAVNVLSPSGLVVTPGVVLHGLDKRTPVSAQEPVEDMADAAYLLCTGDPGTLTGRVTYTRRILREFGLEEFGLEESGLDEKGNVSPSD